MTMREDVLNVLRYEPYCHGATATQLMHFMNAQLVHPRHDPECVRWDGQLWTCVGTCQVTNPTKEPVKLSSLSSLLVKLYNEETLDRYPDFGPRGGYGYVLKKGKKKR